MNASGDGQCVSLAYEEYGEGFPFVWCHDYTGSMDSWKPQIQHFSRRYRVIVYNARGYPPSDVPTDPEAYDQEKSVDDLYHLLGRLGISPGLHRRGFDGRRDILCVHVAACGRGEGDYHRQRRLGQYGPGHIP